MAETVFYNDNTYTRINGKWVDKNYMVVSHLQKTLDNLFSEQKSIEDYTVDELIAEGDKFKEAGNMGLAIKCYKKALEANTPEVFRYVLPKLTSCYRSQGLPQKAIELCKRH